jgi:calcium channel MID1
MSTRRLRIPTHSPTYLFLFVGLLLSYFVSCQAAQDRSPATGSIDASDLGFTSSLESATKSDEESDAGLDYKPIFHALKEVWYGKHHGGPTYLSNNHPSRKSIQPGASDHFIFPLDELLLPRTLEIPVIPVRSSEAIEVGEAPSLELRKRDSGLYRVHLTLSVCRQPSPKWITDGPPPGLDLHISSARQSEKKTESADSENRKLSTDEGFTYFVDEFSEDMRLLVHAPQLNGYDGHYSYEITASIDHPYTFYNDFHSLRHVDSDHTAGMFTTTPLADSRSADSDTIERWMQTGSPFTLFIHNRDDPQILGLRKSYCGLAENAELLADGPGVETGMTTLGGHTVQQQFYMPGLDRGASYHAILGLPSNFSKRGAGTPTGGGMVWRSLEFRANSDDSCQIVSNLTFCNKVNYAAPAPANGSTNGTQLGQVYDEFASQVYQNFSFSLQQIACNTDPSSQYSLATNCSNCDAAYRAWICAVTIPRCADPGANATGLIPRNASSPGRNQFLNDQIQPGPYSELPPCGSLCFGLVQHCPYSLGFACPYPNTWYYNQSYGYQGEDLSVLNCNPYGDPTPFGLNAAESLRPSTSRLLVVVITVSTLLSLGAI